MSVNKYVEHIFVLPEDDANRQIANGFILDPRLNARAVQILPVAGGWTKVVDDFRNVHALEMRRYPKRRIVLLIDFDDQHERRMNHLNEETPPQLNGRVFVLGVRSDPESLKRTINKSFEEIGKALSQDCVNNTREVWGHDLLEHNEPQLRAMISSVKPFLFP
ncbi:MAG: hypothetical protein V1754_06095 [Pseudomonadota bacterium]